MDARWTCTGQGKRPDTSVGGAGSAKALDGEWRAVPEGGGKRRNLIGRVGTRVSQLVLHEDFREPVTGPGRGLGVKRMLSLCHRPQVNPGLMVSTL